MNFWASDCRRLPDRGARALVALRERLRPARLRAGVGRDALRPAGSPCSELVERACAGAYPVALDVDGAALAAFEPVPGTPTSFLIDAGGRMIERHGAVALDVTALRRPTFDTLLEDRGDPIDGLLPPRTAPRRSARRPPEPPGSDDTTPSPMLWVKSLHVDLHGHVVRRAVLPAARVRLPRADRRPRRPHTARDFQGHGARSCSGITNLGDAADPRVRRRCSLVVWLPGWLSTRPGCSWKLVLVLGPDRVPLLVRADRAHVPQRMRTSAQPRLVPAGSTRCRSRSCSRIVDPRDRASHSRAERAHQASAGTGAATAGPTGPSSGSSSVERALVDLRS